MSYNIFNIVNYMGSYRVHIHWMYQDFVLLLAWWWLVAETCCQVFNFTDFIHVMSLTNKIATLLQHTTGWLLLKYVGDYYLCPNIYHLCTTAMWFLLFLQPLYLRMVFFTGWLYIQTYTHLPFLSSFPSSPLHECEVISHVLYTLWFWNTIILRQQWTP